MRIRIDRSKCIGGGNCVVSAPNIFSQDDNDGLVILLSEHPPKGDEEAVRQAEAQCPGRVISIVPDE
jgi:ferredoxin